MYSAVTKKKGSRARIWNGFFPWRPLVDGASLDLRRGDERQQRELLPRADRARVKPRGSAVHVESGQTFQGWFSAVSNPNFATTYVLENSHRDLQIAFRSAALESQMFCQKFVEIVLIFANIFLDSIKNLPTVREMLIKFRGFRIL